MGKIVLLLIFNQDGYDIRLLTKVDKPLNKEIKPNKVKSLA